MFACLLAWAGHDLTAAAPEGPPEKDLAVCMDLAWDVTWKRFYLQAAYWKARRHGLLRMTR